MSYSQPRDRLELRLKEIIDDQIGDVTDRRTRFDALLAAVVDSSVVPPDQRDRLELYLSELAGRAGSPITMQTLNLTLGTSDITGQRDAPEGTAWNRVIILRNINVLKPENIRAGVTVLGIVGNYTGGSAQLTGGTVNLGAAAPVSPLTPPTGYDGFSSVAVSVDSTVIKPENIRKDVSILGVTGTYEPGGSPSWDQPIDLTVTVVDGTYQLSLSLDVRSNTGNTLIWDTITPEEHEEDGYYHYTASLNLINGSGNIRDGFYLTCSNDFDISSWTQNNCVYKEVYHSGQVRTWYFFVPQDATSFTVELTP